MGGLGIDHDDDVLVGKQAGDRAVAGKEVVQLVAPATPVAAEHHQDAAGVALSQRGGGLDLLAGVELGVVDRGACGLLDLGLGLLRDRNSGARQREQQPEREGSETGNPGH